MSTDIDKTIVEWWTGLVAGEPSSRVEWVTGPLGPMHRRSVESLSAMLAADLPVSHVRVRLARGADGLTDVRIETESGGVVTVTRWRPTDGNLDTDVSQGGRTFVKERSAGVLTARATAIESARTDAATKTADETREAIHWLKLHRQELRERIEAGDDRTIELADVEAKLAALADRNVQLIEGRTRG